MCLPSQDKTPLSSGVVGSYYTKEGLGGPRAPELGTPQVRGPVASLWFVRVQSHYCGSRPFGAEGCDKPPAESFETRDGEFSRHQRLLVDLELSFIQYTEHAQASQCSAERRVSRALWQIQPCSERFGLP